MLQHSVNLIGSVMVTRLTLSAVDWIRASVESNQNTIKLVLLLLR